MSSWKIPTGDYHAHFDCFSGAAGDMLLASCLDSCETEEVREQLLAHVVTCLEEGMPELKGEFGIEIKKVWKGIGSIAALHVNVTSKYNHEAAPVPSNRSRSENNASQQDCQQDHSHDEHTQTNHDHSHDHSHSRAEMGGNNDIMTSRFRTVERYWEKDIEIIDGLLKSGFGGGALISSSFNLKDQEITIEHNPHQLSTNFLQGFFADVGFEATVVSMGMSASLPATTDMNQNLTHDVTPGGGIVTQQSVDDDDDNHGNSHSQPTSSIMTSVFKTASPYTEKDIESIQNVIKSEVGEAVVSIDFNLEGQLVTIEHDPQQYSTHDVGGFIIKAGFGVMIISKGMSASLPEPTIVSNASPTKTNAVITTQQSQDDDNDDNEDIGNSFHGHSHDHGSSGGGHNHSHDHHGTSSLSNNNNSKLRNLPEIKQMLESAPASCIAPWVKTNAIAAFTELAEAEAHTHGASSIDAVHFHEVGAVDSIVDTVGTLIALHALGVKSVSISKLPLGEGMVWTDHGLLPIPAPATLRLLIGMPTCRGPPGVTGELVTPTGAALLRALTLERALKLKGRPPDDFVLKQVGIGAGTKNFDKHPNILRLMLGTVGFQ
ncbi:unnamed protein product [Cylindrotheca closterium]|uniref:LarC family nickel insertion protein n=1 Tax=Cylindrotheca closterium TaxID=2856 RepID=A0AAD2PW90_9STRA|nr:unnamed protein product [Cylindrotheca closterium]